MKNNNIVSCILISIIIFIFVNVASATQFFYWDAEGHPCDGSELPNPPFWTQEVSHRGHVACGTTPQGSKYIEWETAEGWIDHYTEIHNTQGLPVTCSLGTTYYLAYFKRFDRIGGVDIWHEGSGIRSSDKGVEITGSGIRWQVSRGQWTTYAANQDHRYTIYMGNASYHLNPELEHNDVYYQNQNGYSNTNPIQLEYETWYGIVMAIKMASNHTGSVAVYVDGVKILEYNNIQTAANGSPTITDIKIGGTLAAAAYDAPPHYRRFDAIMLTDDWQDIIDGGYISGSKEDTTTPTTSGHNPSKSATGIAPNTNIVVHVSDSGDGVDQSSIVMKVEGSPVSPTITGTAANYTLTYDPHSDFSPGQVVDVTIDAKDLHSPANVMATDTYSFTITPPSGTYTEEFGSATGTNYPGTVEDTFININEGKSFASEYLNTYTWPQDTVANAIIMNWDLSAIPSSATIQDATLYLYLSSAGGDDLYDLTVHKIIHYNPVISACTGYTYNGTNSWTPNTQCNNNIPLAQADIATAEDTKSINKTYGYKSWSVTSMVQDWVSNSASNFGMLVNSDPVASSGSNRFFSATESSNPGQRPKLVVTYTVGDDLGAPEGLDVIAP